MEFLYFAAPTSEMVDFVEDGPETCSLCGKVGPCFELENNICDEFDEDELEGKVGCYDCLKQGRFGFIHDTEAGLLDVDGLQEFEDEEKEKSIFIVDNKGTAVKEPDTTEIPKQNSLVSEEALAELRRTPDFSTWQEANWLIHCNDFMVYLGNWQPKDFNKNAPDGRGRKLFLEMTDYDSSNLGIWPENETNFSWGSVSYYAFKCQHCGKLRGYWDAD